MRGALGSEAQTLIRQLSARVAGAVPYRLLDEASWATQGCAPLLRSAITFSARRVLAAGIRRSTCSGAEAAYVERCDDQPAPDPACTPLTRHAASTARLTRLLLSSDLLRVAGWSVLRCGSLLSLVFYFMLLTAICVGTRLARLRCGKVLAGKGPACSSP